MSVGGLSAGWGLSRVVMEPATGSLQPEQGPGVQITDQQVGRLVVDESGWPRPRDWTVNLQCQSQTTLGLIEVPRAQARIEYGLGGASYLTELDIPMAGLAWHVCAQWISVQTSLGAPLVLPPAPSRITISVTPGAPRTQTIATRLPYGTQLKPGEVAVAIAPQGAVALVATTVEYAAGSPVTVYDATGDWVYQTPTPGVFSVRTPLVPMAQPITVTPTFRTLTQGVSIPRDANSPRLNPQGAGGYHYLRWECQQ